MKILAPIVFILSFLACQDPKVEPKEVIGKWNLIEYLADPGDGSGTFQPATIENTLTFFADSTVVSSGKTFCSADQEKSGSSGTFSLETNTIVPDCENAFPIRFTIDGDTLILSFQCIEPCLEKYVRQ